MKTVQMKSAPNPPAPRQPKTPAIPPRIHPVPNPPPRTVPVPSQYEDEMDPYDIGWSDDEFSSAESAGEDEEDYLKMSSTQDNSGGNDSWVNGSDRKVSGGSLVDSLATALNQFRRDSFKSNQRPIISARANEDTEGPEEDYENMQENKPPPVPIRKISTLDRPPLRKPDPKPAVLNSPGLPPPRPQKQPNPKSSPEPDENDDPDDEYVEPIQPDLTSSRKPSPSASQPRPPAQLPSKPSKRTPAPPPESQPKIPDSVPKPGPRGPRQLPQTPKLEELDDFDWYQSSIERQQAEDLMKQLKVDGMYVVRKSTKSTDQPCTLMIYKNGRVYNLPIRRRHDMEYALGKEKPTEPHFLTIPKMIEYFKQRALVLNPGAGETGQTALIRPLPRK